MRISLAALPMEVAHDVGAPRLATLRNEHARLDDEIRHEQARPLPDTVRLQLLKRHKLRIKEAMLVDSTDPVQSHA